MGILRFFVAVLVLVGWTLAAMCLHVVQTPTGIRLITKNQLGFADTFVDARQWSGQDEERHPALYERLLQLDKTDILERREDDQPLFASGAQSESVREAWERLKSEAARRRN